MRSLPEQICKNHLPSRYQVEVVAFMFCKLMDESSPSVYPTDSTTGYAKELDRVIELHQQFLTPTVVSVQTADRPDSPTVITIK